MLMFTDPAQISWMTWNWCLVIVIYIMEQNPRSASNAIQ